ncbi:TetR/AcrR family transcriptional regulator [Granulicella sp. L56]|uniref:TetR/AcrR family transcriptional regulator n=1 Tax=Granulicella sp. L56 TaxID=1747222 RepID=UPI00131E00DD|nr:TetR/AcrR family transcriptional regulator [Granulicella sp. L56]
MITLIVSRRQKQKEELRRVILDAAREIFVDQGYENFSMRKLAKRIEYSPGSIYLHFKNKENLFEVLVEESFALLLISLNDLRHRRNWHDPLEELRSGMQAYVEFGLKNQSDYHFVFMLTSSPQKRPYKVHEAFDVLRDMVKRCVEEKRFRAVDVELTSQALWSSIHGITSLLIQRPKFPWEPQKKLIGHVIFTATESLIQIPNSAKR